MFKLKMSVAVMAAVCLTAGVGSYIETPVYASDPVSIETEVSAEKESSIKGDANGDGVFSVSDAVMLKGYLVGKKRMTMAQFECADMNEDGKVDVFDLCLMKRRLMDSVIMKRIMTEDEFLEIVSGKEEYTWSDFDRYKSEDLSSEIYILRYEIERGDDDNLYLYVTGSDMDEKPERIYFCLCSDNEKQADIYELRDFLNLWNTPENTEEERANAQKIADYAFSELENGNIAVGEAVYVEKSEIPELCGKDKIKFSHFKCVNENTVIIIFSAGFSQVKGYLVTDGTVEYTLGWNYNIDPDFDGGAVDIEEIYDNIYYFYAGI